MAIQSFKLGRSDDYLEGFSNGYRSGFKTGLYFSILILKRHRYDDDVTIEDMVNVLEDYLNRIKEADRKRNEETDDHNRNDI